MPPRVEDKTEVPYCEATGAKQNTEIGTDFNYRFEIMWINVAVHIFMHCMAVYGWYLYVLHVSVPTFAFATFLGLVAGLSITVGAHRYYTHRCYKANLGLRIGFNLAHLLAGQNSMLRWVRDHRLHHKYSDTDADPHNAQRGFFFSHMGWLMVIRHPSARELGRKIDLTDLRNDAVVMFHYKYFVPLYFVVSFLIPVAVPVYFWNESLVSSIFVCYFGRYVTSLHLTWTVNSLAHAWGNKPYDRAIAPSQNSFVALVAMGEGWHNYHHTFPWDYRTSEYGTKLNASTYIIDMFAYLGWAYDLKSASPSLVQSRINRTGDGTHKSVIAKQE